jgi:hypothetical protein
MSDEPQQQQSQEGQSQEQAVVPKLGGDEMAISDQSDNKPQQQEQKQ